MGRSMTAPVRQWRVLRICAQTHYSAMFAAWTFTTTFSLHACSSFSPSCASAAAAVAAPVAAGAEMTRNNTSQESNVKTLLPQKNSDTITCMFFHSTLARMYFYKISSDYKNPTFLVRFQWKSIYAKRFDTIFCFRVILLHELVTIYFFNRHCEPILKLFFDILSNDNCNDNFTMHLTECETKTMKIAFFSIFTKAQNFALLFNYYFSISYFSNRRLLSQM